MKRYELFLLCAVAVATGGCYSTTIRNGRPVGEAPIEADGRWHNGFLGGTEEASGPYQLEKICPEGWAEIETHTSFGNGVLDIVTFGVYNPQTIDVKCAAKAEPRKTASATASSTEAKTE